MNRNRQHGVLEARESTRLRTLLAVVSLLSFMAPAAVPHWHGLNAHEAGVCAGHLNHEGAEEALHAGSCAACSAPRRNELEATPTYLISWAPPFSALLAHHGEPCHNPVRPTGDCEKSRAPPANRLES